MFEIEGIDRLAGLANTGQNEALYTRLLVKFAKKQATFLARCTALLENAEFADAQRMAHDLRSNAATLGALDLARRAGHLETAIARGLDAPALLGLLRTVSDSLAPLVVQLEREFGDRAS